MEWRNVSKWIEIAVTALAVGGALTFARPVGVRVITRDDGFKFGSSSNLPWPEIERHYREELAGRGWQHEWTRELATMPPGYPPEAPRPRWSLFRRLDGLMLVGRGVFPNGQTTIIVSDYTYLRRRFDAEHLLRK